MLSVRWFSMMLLFVAGQKWFHPDLLRALNGPSAEEESVDGI
jgi:hypothetical protein